MSRASKASQQWQQEKPELNPMPMEVLGRLFELSQQLADKHINPLFTQYGLAKGEFDVLATLRRAGTPFVMTPTALYDSLMISSGGMTHRLLQLEKAKLISRCDDENDRRAKLVVLTKTGLQLIEKILPLHIENEIKLLELLSTAEQQQFNQICRRWLAKLNQL